MSTVQNDPAELRRFMEGMRQFNDEVSTSLHQVRQQLYTLGIVWQDGQYAQFSSQLETALLAFQRYLNTADNYHRYLDRKATDLEQYLAAQ
jgi:hypothetical protein